jgi:hypothetical protein
MSDLNLIVSPSSNDTSVLIDLPNEMSSEVVAPVGNNANVLVGTPCGSGAIMDLSIGSSAITGVLVSIQDPSYVVEVMSLSPPDITVEVGPQIGRMGPSGVSYSETFESISKNLKSYDFTLNNISGVLSSVDYASPSGTITKTLGYISGVLNTITLSGDTPSGIYLVKTLNYLSGNLIGASYS